jgi:dihydrodipicolinate synthase/N-acetylneuraminate lyase
MKDVPVGREQGATAPVFARAGNGALADPLWVPVLSHYRREGVGRLDPERTAAHIAALRPHVCQILLAGSTGDSWELDAAAVAELVRLARQPDPLGGDCRLLFGALRPTTEEVIERAAAIERLLADGPRPAAAVVGLAVCPPVDPAADEGVILRHYARVLAATTLPVAVYELPQVTRCSLTPRVVEELAQNPRIIMFKDSGGVDTIANAGAATGLTALRGAEGGYAAALRPHGPYDGWLLSTGNVFPDLLQAIARSLRQGEAAAARSTSDALSAAVERLFRAASSVPFGNAFSNANRAGDHVLAWGKRWRDTEPPVTVSGATLPVDLLAEAEAAIASVRPVPEEGYLTDGAGATPTARG